MKKMKGFFYTEREKKIFTVTFAGGAVNALLLVLKFVAGIWGHSSAMVADAINSLSDFITDIGMLIFVRISSKPSDDMHKYGHGKYETLSSAVISGVMIFLGISIFVKSILKITDLLLHDAVIMPPNRFALVIAVLSILFKFLIFRYTKKWGKALGSTSLNAKAYDHRNDVFVSSAVLIGIMGAIFLGHKWVVLEPIAALVVSLIIIYTGIQLFIPAIQELLEISLPKSVQAQIIQVLHEEPEILSFHKLHTRSIGYRYAIEVDIRVKGETTVLYAHDLTKRIEDKLMLLFGEHTHIIIHVEPAEEEDRDPD